MLRQIVTAPRSRVASRRLRLPAWRWAVRGLLAAFLLVNVVDWPGALFFVALTIAGWAAFLGELLGGTVGALDGAIALGEIALATGVIWVIAAVVSGDKRTVLYLRRFRAQAPLAQMRRALESGLGRRYRVVTLYDGVFEPLEVPPPERWLNRAVLPLLGAGLALAGGITVYLGALVFFGAPILFGLVVVAFLLLRLRIRRRSRIAVDAPADLARCVTRIERLRGFWARPAALAPQASVVVVRDELWQVAVAALSGSVDALVVDVGAPSANLAWELERLAADGFRRCVLVAERGALAAWTKGPRDPALERCAALLAGQDVLVYEGHDRAARRRFRRSLGRLLDQAATGLWPAQRTAA